MSKSTIRSRLVRAGLVTGAVATVLLASAPPAMAANLPVTLTPATGPVGGGNDIVAFATNFLAGVPSPVARFTTATTCPLTGTAVSASNLAAPLVRDDDSTATITVPAVSLLATPTYRVCIYASATGALEGNAVYTVIAAEPALSATTGPAAGGNTITATAAGPYLTTATSTPGVTFTTGACTPTYNTTAPNIAGTAVKTSADVATITVPSALAAPGAYKVCLYAGTTLNSSVRLGASTATYTPGAPTATLSPLTGPNGGGNAVTITRTGFLTGITTPGVTFSVAACPVLLSTATANLVATATATNDNTASFNVPTGVLAPSAYNVCVYNSNVNGGGQLIASSAATYSVALPNVTLSPTVGPDGGGNTVTATSTTAYLLGVATPGVTFSKAACPSKYTAGSGNLVASSIARISNFKVAAGVPSSVVNDSGDATTDYNMCIYRGTVVNTSTLVSSAGAYSVAPVLDVTGISPSAGPAQGGSLVTITGTGFPEGDGANITASIGGSPLTGIVAGDDTTFTGYTTAHAPGDDFTVSVTTDSGTKVGGAYDFTYGITVTPNTAPNTGPEASLYLDVMGAGFSQLETGFNAGTGTPADSNTAQPHVYLVDGLYDPTDDTPGKVEGQVDECIDVMVISDVELICQLDLTNSLANTDPVTAGGPVPVGTYTVTVVDDGAIGASDPDASIISSGSTFTVAPY